MKIEKKINKKEGYIEEIVYLSEDDILADFQARGIDALMHPSILQNYSPEAQWELVHWHDTHYPDDEMHPLAGFWVIYKLKFRRPLSQLIVNFRITTCVK